VQPSVIGWDIGGANVKAAAFENQTITQVDQISCPLWKGVEELLFCINGISHNFCQDGGLHGFHHAITMTGELVDHFDDRMQGVTTIINTMSSKLNADQNTSNVQYFAGNNGFLEAQQAATNYRDVASANWLASVNYAASKIPNALFIDIGSTTTDIVAIRDHVADNTGFTDEQRLIEKELVYCGVIRTPVFAISQFAQLEDRRIPVINEYFSNTADVYRLTGELPLHADISDTLDGRAKDLASSAVRLARMFANDAKEEQLENWKEVAMQIRNSQIQVIKDACRHQIMKKGVALSTPIIGAGVGRFLVKQLASQLGRDYIEFDELFESKNNSDGFSIGDCAPAAAVACLAASSIAENNSAK